MEDCVIVIATDALSVNFLLLIKCRFLANYRIYINDDSA